MLLGRKLSPFLLIGGKAVTGCDSLLPGREGVALGLTGWGAAAFRGKGKGKVQKAAVLFPETGSAFFARGLAPWRQGRDPLTLFLHGMRGAWPKNA